MKSMSFAYSCIAMKTKRMMKKSLESNNVSTDKELGPWG